MLRAACHLASLSLLLMIAVSCAGPEDAVAPESPDRRQAPAPDSAEPLPATQQLPVTVEGQTELRPARLFESPQGYAIYVLPQIVMTAEEPGRDQAFARVDGEFFMRIERLDAQADVDDLRENARLALQDIGDVQVVAGEAASHPLWRGAEFILRATSPEVSVTRLVAQVDGSLFAVTLHIPNREPAEGIAPSFRAMLGSIRVLGPWQE